MLFSLDLPRFHKGQLIKIDDIEVNILDVDVKNMKYYIQLGSGLQLSRTWMSVRHVDNVGKEISNG